jgi:diguanylate cyclase (GGDEF)-like protein
MYLNFENITFYKEEGVLKVKLKDLSHILQYKYLAKYNSKEVNQFLSPKLIWAEKVDASADLYSLGVVFYYLYYKYDYRLTPLSLESLENNEIHYTIHRLTTHITEDAFSSMNDFIEVLVKLIRMPYDFNDKIYYERLNFKNRLVGRDKEINRIITMTEKSLQLKSNENCLFIHGRRGVGKSRVLQELGYRFDFLGYSVFNCKNKESGHFGFFKSVLLEIAFNEVVDINLIRKYGDEIGALLPQIAEHWRIPKGHISLEKMGYLRVANRIYKFLEEYINSKQLIIVIDNISTIDPYDLRVLEYLINTEREIPLFIVIGADLEDEISNDYSMNYTEEKVAHMSIVNYSYSDTSEFIRTCLGQGKEDIKFVSAIMKRTNGNPSQIINAINYLFNEGKIFVDDKRKWDFSQVNSHKDINVLEAVHQDLVPLNTFNSDELNLLEFLSVSEMPIIDEIIIEILGLSGLEFEKITKSLMSMKVIDSKFSDWGFSYYIDNRNVKRDLNQRLKEDERVDYNKKIAAYLESKCLIDQKFLDDHLIYHLEQSNQFEKCATYSLTYAKRLKSFSLKEAQSLIYYNKALYHAEKVNDQDLLVKIHLCIGDIYQETDQYDEAIMHYMKAKDLSAEMDYDDKKIDAIISLGLIELKRLNYEEAKDLFLETLDMSKECAYVGGELKSAVCLIDFYFEIQDYQRSIELIDHYISQIDGKVYNRSLGQFNHRKATYYFHMGDYQKAMNYYTEAIEVMEGSENIDIISRCNNNIGVVNLQYLGEYEKAIEYFALAEEDAMRNNIFVDLPIFRCNMAAALFKFGRHEEAMTFYDESMTLAIESNDRRDFFVISKDIVRDFLTYSYYDKAYSILKKLEIDYSGIIHADKYMERHTFLNIVYYLTLENYDLAYKWYLTYKTCKNNRANRKFSMKLFQTIFEENCLQTSEDVSESLLWRLAQLKESLVTVQDAQLLRQFTLQMSKRLLSSTNFILLRKYIDFDKSLIERYNSPFLSICHEIYEGLFSDNRIESYKEVLRKYSGREYNSEKWICHKLLGDEYHQNGNFYEAMSHYTTALDMVKNLTLLLPEEIKRTYIVNDPLKLQLKNRIFELYGKILNGRSFESILMIESEINSVEEFFEVSELSKLYDHHRFNNDAYETLYKDKFVQKSSLEHIVKGIVQEDEQNLYGILTYFIQILSADYGRIVFKDDVNGIQKIFELGEGHSEDIEVVKNNLYYENEGTFVNVYEESLYSYLLQEERKALLYIPIFERIAYREKDNFDDIVSENEVGYIYLESSKVLNNFNKENLQKCQMMLNLVKTFLDSYRLRVLSTIDKLTGVYLRKHTEECFNEDLSYARRNNSELAVIMCDIDKFKHVNDTYGHRKGDEILKNIGGILNEIISPIGYVGRYGGEEFIIVLPGVDSYKAFELSEMLRNRIEKEIRVEARKPVTISLGVSCYPAHGLSEEELIENADKALYYSKNTGRNKSSLWTKDIAGDHYRFDRLAGILTGNSAVDATNMQSIVEIIGMLTLKLDKEGKLLKVLENLIDITKGEIAYIVECKGEGKKQVYMKERGSNRLNLEYEPDANIIEKYCHATTGSYFVNWDAVVEEKGNIHMPNWKSIIVTPLFDGEVSRGLVVVEVPIVEREFDFNNYNYVNLMSGLISAII